MRGMERQALKTDAAVASLGATLDGIGSKKQLKQFDEARRGIRNLGVDGETATKKVDRGIGKLDQTVKRHSARWTTFKKGIKDTFGELRKFTMLGLKLGGIGALIGLAAQGIGNLAGGVTSLLPRFGQLTGMWGAAVPLLGAMAQTAIVAKVAFGGLTQAMAGNARALHQLAPAGQRFVKQWRAMRMERLALTRGIQQPLFSKINAPFKAAFKSAEPTLQRGLGGVSSALGGVISQALGSFSTPQFLAQFSKLSGGSATTVTRLGGATINLAHGLTSVAVAAQPLVSWITKSVSAWVKQWAITQKLNAENGKLATKFGKAKTALRGLWRTGKDIFAVFKVIMHAATGLGNSLYGAADRSMERWVKFHQTIAGQEGLIRDFNGMESGFRAIFRLVGAIGGELFKMGSQGGLAKTADALTKMVPALGKGLNTFANSLGPALAQGIGSIVNLFSTLGTGPLPLVLHGITALLNAMSGIVNASGPFKGVFTTIFSTLLISRYLVKLGLLQKGWWGVAFAARSAGAAEAGASAGGILGPVGIGVRGGVGRVGGFLGRLGRGGRAAGEAEQLAIPGLEAASGASRGAGLLGMLGGLGGASRVLGVAGKFAWPLAAISGILGGLTAQRSGSFGNQVGQTAFGAVNPLTFGLLGKTGLSDYFSTPAQKAAAYVGKDNKSLANDLQAATAGRTGLSKLTAELGILEQHAEKIRGSRQQAYQDYMSQLNQEIAARKQLVAQLQQAANQKDRGRANQFLSSLTGTGRRLIAKNGLVAGFHAADIMGLQYLNTGGLNQAGRGQVERGLLHNAYRASQRDPRLKGEYSQLAGAVSGIEQAFGHAIAVGPLGRIFQGTQSELAALNNQLKIARASGNSSGAGFILQEIAASKAAAAIAGHKHAGGGRIAGSGLRDTVPVPGGMAAPGELIVNRHTERRANGILGRFGMSLGGMVGRESRPHSASMYATGGRLYHGLPAPHAGIESIGNAVMSRYPLSVTSTTRGGHASGSYHYKGEAIDLSGSQGAMSQASAWIRAHLTGRLLEGIHNRGLSVKNGASVPASYWGSTTWGQHRNHIHLAAAGGVLGNIAAMAGAATKGAGGAVKSAGAHAGSLGFFDPGNLAGFGGIKTTMFGGGTANGASGSTGAGAGPTAGRYGKAALMRLAGSVGFPSGTRNMAAAIALAESAGRPNAKNVNTDGSIDRGLWQINSVHGAQSTFNPTKNAESAYSISHGGTSWGPWSTFHNGAYKKYLARGGRMPKFGGWFGRGGSFTTTGPTMIGVGEKGKERVSVSPAHSGSHTGSYVFAPVLQVTGASQVDVERAIENAMHKFADIIDRAAVDGVDIAV